MPTTDFSTWMARIQARVVVRGGVSARPGQSVVAEIVGYPESLEAPIEVVLLKVLGKPDDPRTEVEKTLACADISEEFPKAVVSEVTGIPSVVQAADFQDRADLRQVPFTTIDPETARDFDDAVALEELPRGGHRLWVAVADVSHYLREGTALDHDLRQIQVQGPAFLSALAQFAGQGVHGAQAGQEGFVLLALAAHVASQGGGHAGIVEPVVRVDDCGREVHLGDGQAAVVVDAHHHG